MRDSRLVALIANDEWRNAVMHVDFLAVELFVVVDLQSEGVWVKAGRHEESCLAPFLWQDDLGVYGYVDAEIAVLG